MLDKLSDNRQLCFNRLKSLQSRLSKDADLFKSYDQIFRDQLAAGIIERVPADKETKVNSHFLPHHGVTPDDKQTSKLRTVFDGSAKSSKFSSSLNECLEMGPNYVPQILDLLINFRVNSIALTADIEKAFLQISIDKEDRDYLRFYWFDDVTSNNPSIVQYRWARVQFGMTLSPAILDATLDNHIALYKENRPDIIDSISKFYVDDMTTGCLSVNEGLEIYETAKEITKAAYFNLRKWNSTSKELLAGIEQRKVIQIIQLLQT